MGSKFDEYEEALRKGKGPLRVAGSASITDEEVRVSGSAHLPGGLKARIVHASGSVTIGGDASAGEFHVAGSGSALGTLEAENLEISGSFRGKSLKGRNARIAGSCKLDGDINLSEFLELAGSLRVSGTVQVTNGITLRGAFDVRDAIKTKTLDVRLSESDSHARGGVEVTDITVLRGEASRLIFFKPMWKSRGRLFTPYIKAAGKVRIENVVCDDLEGNDVEIGEGCEIRGKITYKKSIAIDPRAKIANPPIKRENC